MFSRVTMNAFRAIAVTMLLQACIAGSATAGGRRVLFVDATRAGGAGSYEQPYATLAEAQASSVISDIIYVAQAATPYEGGITLKRGQMLIGSAFGLDAVRTELHVDIEATGLPAAAGTGPLIRGGITVPGDNVVAGCTVIADAKSGTGISAAYADGPITLRMVNARTSGEAWALYVDSVAYPLSWTSGRIDAADRGAGILINGGSGAVTFDHVSVSGDFSTGIAIRGRTGGAVTFKNASPIKIQSSTREGIALLDLRGSVAFESPVQLTTNGGRGFTANHVQNLFVTGGSSWIEATNAQALALRDSRLDVSFHHISATATAGATYSEGIVLDRVNGRFHITGDAGQPATGGTISGAQSYGIRLAQSSGIKLSNIRISGGGTVSSKDECPPDIPANTNVRCRAGLYLRHVEASSFENMLIEDNAGVGINANNVVGVSFADIHVSRTGDRGTEPAMLINEVRGELTFTRCSFLNGAGGAVAIEQRFNAARITFESCELAAGDRPMAAAGLLRARVAGGGSLDLQLLNSRFHDNAAGGAVLTAADSATLFLTARNTSFLRLGATAVDFTARDRARVSLVASDNEVATPAVREPVLLVHAVDAAAMCVDMSGNRLAGERGPAARLWAQSPKNVLQVVTDGSAPVAFLGQANGGLVAAIDGSATPITAKCR